jgi:FMN-dependent NADH-azoreductase
MEVAKGKNLEFLDLLVDVPDMFLTDNLNAYKKRNYGGQELSAEEAALMVNMDRMTAQLKNADAVVLAFPMHNFSLPAAVKAWFDSVLQKGETWTLGEGGYVPLMKGKKALVLISSGGIYEGDSAGYEHAESLARVEFGFMGFDTEVVSAGGMNMLEDPQTVIAEKQQIVREIAKKWYS